jgi:pullulanase/glycogen debranching enzyme
MTHADAASGSTRATKIWPGKAYPLGATYDGAGTNFAVFSEVAERGIPDRDPRGHRVTDDSFMLCFNAHYEPLQFTMPPTDFGASWEQIVDTAAQSTPPTSNQPTPLRRSPCTHVLSWCCALYPSLNRERR